VIETSAGAGAVNVAEPLIPAALAVIVAVPCATLDANPPSLASLVTIDTLEDEELHSTEDRT
jgi:hypothetical protein